MKRRHKIGVEVIVFNKQGHILLVRREDDRTWSLPGGWVESDETLERAAIREAREETGLKIALRSLAAARVRRGGTIHLTYFAKRLSGSLKNSKESIDVKYCVASTIHNWHADHELVVRHLLSCPISPKLKQKEKKFWTIFYK